MTRLQRAIYPARLLATIKLAAVPPMRVAKREGKLLIIVRYK